MKTIYLLIGLVFCTLTACGPFPEEITVQTQESATDTAASWIDKPTLILSSIDTLTPTTTNSKTTILTSTQQVLLISVKQS